MRLPARASTMLVPAGRLSTTRQIIGYLPPGRQGVYERRRRRRFAGLATQSSGSGLDQAARSSGFAGSSAGSGGATVCVTGSGAGAGSSGAGAGSSAASLGVSIATGSSSGGLSAASARELLQGAASSGS